MKLQGFQKKFLGELLRPDIRTAALSLPRGNGKSTLCAWLCSRLLDPKDPLFCNGQEIYLVASSLSQCCRTTFGILRKLLPKAGYRIAESTQVAQILHLDSRTRLSVLPASGKSNAGIVGAAYVICDEPASWHEQSGTLLHESIAGALGKPDSDLRIIYAGTKAIGGISPPDPNNWWPTMLREGSRGSRYVQVHEGSLEGWDKWSTIQKCNPLMARFPESRRVLLEERDAARKDGRLRAAFLSDRLNIPSADESVVLLTAEDWKGVLRRKVAPREGAPVVGIDLGGSRAWSAATASYWNGRTEAVAVAPGIPSIRDQEIRDCADRGSYQRLVDEGSLIVAEGLRVPDPNTIADYVMSTWRPRAIICDRFRLDDLKDTNASPLIPRVTRWSDASSDIRALRKAAADGPLSVATSSRALLQASLKVSKGQERRFGEYDPNQEEYQ